MTIEARDVEPRDVRSLAGVIGDGGFLPLLPLISCSGFERALPKCSLADMSRDGVPFGPCRPLCPVVRTGRAEGCEPLGIPRSATLGPPAAPGTRTAVSRVAQPRVRINSAVR